MSCLYYNKPDANKLSFSHEIHRSYGEMRCQRGRSPTLTPHFAKNSQ